MVSYSRCSLIKVTLTFCMLLGAAASALAETLTIAKNAESIKPVAVGEPLPTFTVKDAEGHKVTFSADNLEKPLVIVTYRGGWCPYCNVQLQELRKVLPEINQLGANVAFLTGDAPEDIYSSMKEKTREEIKGLNYTIYSDAELNAASELGIAFYLKQATLDKLDQYGLAKKSSVENHKALPVPSVFVVSQSGEVRYSFFDPDYTVRLNPDELLAQVRSELADN